MSMSIYTEPTLTCEYNGMGRDAFSAMTIAFVCLVLMLPGQVFAQSTSGGTGWFIGMLDAIGQVIVNIINNTFGNDFSNRLIQSGKTLASQTTTVANGLAGALALVTLVWRIILAMVDKRSVVSAATEVLIFSIIALAIINRYDVLVDQVWGTAMDIMTAVGLDIGTTFLDFITSFVQPLSKVFENMSSAPDASQFWAQFGLGLLDVTLDTVATMILMVVALIFLLVSMKDIVGVFIMGPLFFAVGVIFGPVMVATIVSDFTRKWFDQWLNYLVSSAFLTVVAVAVLKLLSLTISNSLNNAGQGQSTIAMLGVVLITATISRLFQAVPTITDAIFPGRTGSGNAINGSTGSAKAGGTPGGVAKAAAGSAGGSAAGAAVGAAAGVAGGAAAAAAAQGASSGGGGVMSKMSGALQKAGDWADKEKGAAKNIAAKASAIGSTISNASKGNPIAAVAAGLGAAGAMGSLAADAAKSSAGGVISAGSWVGENGKEMLDIGQEGKKAFADIASAASATGEKQAAEKAANAQSPMQKMASQLSPDSGSHRNTDGTSGANDPGRPVVDGDRLDKQIQARESQNSKNDNSDGNAGSSDKLS